MCAIYESKLHLSVDTWSRAFLLYHLFRHPYRLFFACTATWRNMLPSSGTLDLHYFLSLSTTASKLTSPQRQQVPVVQTCWNATTDAVRCIKLTSAIFFFPLFSFVRHSKLKITSVSVLISFLCCFCFVSPAVRLSLSFGFCCLRSPVCFRCAGVIHVTCHSKQFETV